MRRVKVEPRRKSALDRTQNGVVAAGLTLGVVIAGSAVGALFSISTVLVVLVVAFALGVIWLL